ncbi:hypothetical protein TIFTF001_037715 [Ficus carica]|uniref:Uncharacterized protein n=1 Tax=Ficus carica TaxID=3494 RepID=A0AA88J999_FICCA|nr:hypothetical protein TIFTF001_037715 [Ficus carica]
MGDFRPLDQEKWPDLGHQTEGGMGARLGGMAEQGCRALEPKHFPPSPWLICNPRQHRSSPPLPSEVACAGIPLKTPWLICNHRSSQPPEARAGVHPPPRPKSPAPEVLRSPPCRKSPED